MLSIIIIIIIPDPLTCKFELFINSYIYWSTKMVTFLPRLTFVFQTVPQDSKEAQYLHGNTNSKKTCCTIPHDIISLKRPRLKEGCSLAQPYSKIDQLVFTSPPGLKTSQNETTLTRDTSKEGSFTNHLTTLMQGVSQPNHQASSFCTMSMSTPLCQ